MLGMKVVMAMRRVWTFGIIAALISAFVATIAPNTACAQRREDPIALHKKASELENSGKYTEAVPYARRALEIEERRSGPNHLNVAILLNRLAILYDDLARYTDAEQMYKRSLAIREKVRGSSHPDVAQVQNTMSQIP